MGIRYFDTAPAYGFSEIRLGKWLKSLTSEERKSITIATKFGEYWNFEENKPFRDFTFHISKESIDRSSSLLGEINCIQVHGFTKEVWEQNEVGLLKAFDYARGLGIKHIGVSLSNPDGAEIAFTHDEIDLLQFPHNILKPYEKSIINEAIKKNKNIVVNRPFAMGEVVTKDEEQYKLEAYKFILRDVQNGIILTGTKSITHLEENITIFNQAQKENTFLS